MRQISLSGVAAIALSLGLVACGQPAPPTSSPPQASAPARPAAPNVSDLQGARAAGGQSEMETRGFTVARQRGLTAFWLHAPSGSCVRTVTSNGRYQTVEPVAASNCGR